MKTGMFNKILTRLGNDDELEANCSTFAMEMRQMCHILEHSDEKSLVIVDELGRGTSTLDGVALTTAISEALMQRKAHVYLVTHFLKMAEYLHTLACVDHLHLQTVCSGNYKVQTPDNSSTCYGIDLAASLDLDETFVANARSLLTKVHTF